MGTAVLYLLTRKEWYWNGREPKEWEELERNGNSELTRNGNGYGSINDKQ
jgi:hypothetical protein